MKRFEFCGSLQCVVIYILYSFWGYSLAFWLPRDEMTVFYFGFMFGFFCLFATNQSHSNVFFQVGNGVSKSLFALYFAFVK